MEGRVEESTEGDPVIKPIAECDDGLPWVPEGKGWSRVLAG